MHSLVGRIKIILQVTRRYLLSIHTQFAADGQTVLCGEAAPVVIRPPPPSPPGGGAAAAFLWWPIVVSLGAAAMLACCAFFAIAAYRRRKKREREEAPSTAAAVGGLAAGGDSGDQTTFSSIVDIREEASPGAYESGYGDSAPRSRLVQGPELHNVTVVTGLVASDSVKRSLKSQIDTLGASSSLKAEASGNVRQHQAFSQQGLIRDMSEKLPRVSDLTRAWPHQKGRMGSYYSDGPLRQDNADCISCHSLSLFSG